MGGKGGSSGGGGGVTYKGTHLTGAGAAGKGDFGARGPMRTVKEGGKAESRGYQGAELTEAAKQSLAQSAKSAVRGFATGGFPGAALGFVGKAAQNAEDVELANRMGVNLEDARLAAKHDSQSTNKGLLGTLGDDDDDGGFDPGEGGFGGFGGDPSKW